MNQARTSWRAVVAQAICVFAGLAVGPTLAVAQQLPNGGTVTAGTATIGTPQGGTLNISQSSNRAIINWQSYSIGQGGLVHYDQPSSSAATLNRVTGNTPSSIAGTITAPGTVLLVNPNGIAITKSGVINTGSFAASTLDIKDSDFMSGNYKFTGNGNSAAVTNAGRINVSDGGFAALLGGQVANDGVITARLGKVALGSGELITLDLSGDGFLSVAVPTKDLGKITGADGQTLVTNSGKIRADGGLVVLKAATAAGILRDAVNVPGAIRANSVGMNNGRIVLGGGAGGRVSVAGRLKARGRKGANGGAVSVTGADIDLTGKINVSSKGKGTHGGTAYVFADGTLNFGGLILAEGGEGGAGGYVETSGAHVHVADGARVSTLAQNGVTGAWLIDPNDFTVAASGGDMTGAQVAAALASNNFEIKSDNGLTAGNGDIFVNDAVTWSSNHSLTLTAVRNIAINADVTATGTNAGLVLTYGGDYSLAAGKSVTLSGASAALTINGTSYTLLHSMADVQNINGDLSGHYALAVSLDALTDLTTPVNWAPIGTDGLGNVSGSGFTGTFAGLGHTISNLTVDIGTNNYAGLFGYSAGTIRDVGIVGAVVAGNNKVGTLAGHNEGVISNSYAIDICGCGEVDGSSSVGGLVGENVGVISGSHASVAVFGTGNSLGGLIGFAGAGSVTNSYATGTIFGDLITASNVGGLIGSTNPGVTVSGSYATGSVEGSTAVGGLIGYNLANVTQSYATGNVRGTDRIGGLIGWADTFAGFGLLDRVFATGLVDGDPSAHSTNVGGLVGFNSATINDAYATGAVAGDDFVGGLIGFNNAGATVTDAYASGLVTFVNGATSNFGALVGANQGTIANGYWNTQTSGQTVAIGVESLGGASTTSGVTTAQLQAAVPAGFDSSIWDIIPGVSTPYMKWRFPTGPTVVSGTAAGFTGGDSGLVVGVAIDGVVLPANTATGADGSYAFMLDPTAAGSAAFTYLTTDVFPHGLSEPSNAIADLGASAPGFVQGHATGLDFAPNRVLTVASSAIVDMGGVIALMERALYGPALATSVPTQLFELGLDPIDIVRFDSSTFFSELIFTPFGGANYRLQSAAANFNFNQPLGCGCDLINLELVVSGNLAINQSIVASGSVLMTAPGDITIGSGGSIEAGSSGDAIVLAAGGNFTNDAGSSALLLGGSSSRWLIYSNAPAADVFGGLDSANTAVWNATYATLPPASVTQSGNRYLFAFQPTLTFTSTGTLTKNVGDDASAAVAGSTYTVSGLQGGVANAFLGDAAASVYSGAPAFTSAGSAASASAAGSPYSIDGNTGTLVSLDNYAFAFVNSGTLTVNAAPSNPNSNSNTDANSPSQFQPPPGGNDTTPVNITFQQNQTNTTPTLITLTTPANQNVAPGSGGAESLFPPIWQFDKNQYSNDTLPDFAPQAGEATVLAMIARAEQNNRQVPKIDALWGDGTANWPSNDNVLKNVSFTDGNGQSRIPAGNNGFAFVEGATDVAAMLQHGPVMLSGAASGGQPPATPWLLAIKVTDDGEGIIANDPATGLQVVLAYDPATKTVGGAVAVIDPKSNKLVSLGTGAPDVGNQNGHVPPAAWDALKAFKPASFFAVSI